MDELVCPAAERAQIVGGVEAELAGQQVEADFDHGDLAKVEIGGDDLPADAGGALLRDLAQELVGDALEQLELLLLGDFLFVLGFGRGQAAEAGGGHDWALRAAMSATPAAIFMLPLALAIAMARSKAARKPCGFPVLEQLVDAIGGHADGERGAALGAGGGQSGDEGALPLGRPAVGALGLARDGGEIEEVAEVGEVGLAAGAGGAATVADDGDGGGGWQIGHGGCITK